MFRAKFRERHMTNSKERETYSTFGITFYANSFFEFKNHLIIFNHQLMSSKVFLLLKKNGWKKVCSIKDATFQHWLKKKKFTLTTSRTHFLPSFHFYTLVFFPPSFLHSSCRFAFTIHININENNFYAAAKSQCKRITYIKMQYSMVVRIMIHRCTHT